MSAVHLLCQHELLHCDTHLALAHSLRPNGLEHHSGPMNSVFGYNAQGDMKHTAEQLQALAS